MTFSEMTAERSGFLTEVCFSAVSYYTRLRKAVNSVCLLSSYRISGCLGSGIQ